MKLHYRAWSFLIVLGVTTSSFGVPAWSKQPGIEGHYLGILDLTYDRPRKVPIEVTLTMTGETVTVQTGPGHFEERQVIDGAFLVDDEGGPFAFTRVSYNLDKNLLDLRYDRRQFTSASSPADFRLVGSFDPLGNLKGTVLSGNRGPIGTFTMRPVDRVGLDAKRKYSGRWIGTGRFNQGGIHSFDIVISESLQQTDNPFDFEFDYTPGKMAYYAVDTYKFNFNNIAIDYLRQRIFLSKIDGSRNTLTAECDVDFENRTMKGTLYGMYKGKSAELRLRKVN
jgi:hypothetical protein